MFVLYGTLIAAVFLFKCNCYVTKEINFKLFEVGLVLWESIKEWYLRMVTFIRSTYYGHYFF